MRADRLIRLLLLLQRRQRVTAAEVAIELEVSERTARRDLDALAMSGVPLYSTHGRGGGWQLIGGATTDLTGLSADEAKALFLAVGPAVEGLPVLRSAMEKVSGALPVPFRADAEAAAGAVKVDPNGWSQVGGGGDRTILDQLTSAVVEGRKARIDYEGPRAPRRERVVHPLGLVTKRNVWYLVANTYKGLRTFKVERVRSVSVLDEPVTRPPDFDLDVAWEGIVTSVQEDLGNRVGVEMVVDPPMLGPVRWMFSNRLQEHEARPDGRVRFTIAAYSARSFAGQIAGFGSSVELIDPPAEVLAELQRITAELRTMYG